MDCHEVPLEYRNDLIFFRIGSLLSMFNHKVRLTVSAMRNYVNGRTKIVTIEAGQHDIL